MILSFLNQKGGVGKTTIAHNTAYYLATSLKKKVLLIDLDPQGNTSSIYSSDKEKEPSISNIFKEKSYDINNVIFNACIKDKGIENLDIIHSNKNISQALKEIPIRTHREKILYKAINKIVVKYDYIIIDCPASIEDSVINAIYASDKFIIPIEMGGFVSSAIQDMLEIIAEVKEYDDLNNLLESNIIMFVKNKIDKRGTHFNQTIIDDLKPIEKYIFDNGIHHSLFVSKATNMLLPIIDYEEMPKSILNDYRKYVDELIQKCS